MILLGDTCRRVNPKQILQSSVQLSRQLPGERLGTELDDIFGGCVKFGLLLGTFQLLEGVNSIA